MEERSNAMQPAATVKQRIIEMLQRLPDNIDYDRAIESITVLQKIEIALEQVERGEVYEHEDVMRELLGEDEVPAQVGARSEG
jgi:hypothetical protein